MPIFWYMLRRCGTLKICDSFSNESRPSVPKKPGCVRRARVAVADRACGSRCSCGSDRDGSSGCRRRADVVEVERGPPAARRERVVEVADRVRRIADLRATKFAKSVMSRVGELGVALPTRPGNATLNDLNALSSSKMPAVRLRRRRPACRCRRRTARRSAGSAPLRSPRQCIAPWLSMPRRLCVVIGPLTGCWRRRCSRCSCSAEERRRVSAWRNACGCPTLAASVA